jgi:DNA-binding response OmpR family regulator
MMVAQSERKEEAASEWVRVSVLAWPGAGEPKLLVQSLARDAIDARPEPVERALAEPPARPIVLALLPGQAPDAMLTRLVDWRGSAAATTRLIGVAPRGGGDDAERALEVGFDDFVAGRASTREISARIRAMARRLGARARRSEERTRFGRVVLDPSRHELWIGEQRVPLTAMELAVLAALIRAGGRTVTREQLLDEVWGHDDLDVGVRAVDNLVCRLRRKLGQRSLLVTVRGMGFRLSDR